jgi:hypothetical protein
MVHRRIGVQFWEVIRDFVPIFNFPGHKNGFMNPDPWTGIQAINIDRQFGLLLLPGANCA